MTKVALAPFQMRVVEEREALEDKLAKLTAFIFSNPLFKDLPADEQFRLRLQQLTMNQYREILNERIANFQ